MSKRIIIASILLVILSGLQAQLSKNHKSLYLEAEYNYLIEYYDKALHQFENLLLADPENSNLNYLCGLCTSELPGKNEQSINYFEKAVQHVSDAYREGSYKETNAPQDAYLLLARSYHIASRFKDAIQYYTVYRDSTGLDDFSEIEFVNQQIKSVELAMSMVDKPRKVRFNTLIGYEKADRSYSNPVVSGNDSTLIYLEDKYGNLLIMMTNFENSEWSSPRTINGELGISGNYQPTCLSYDGTTLYLVQMDYYNTELYVAQKKGKHWGKAVLLNKNINTRYSENHASVSKDGNQLFFTSDRKGGHGGMDIYRSVKDPDGEWQQAENLGPEINTIYNEASPFLTGNDSKLYFSSEGHQTMGGYDIFVSTAGGDNNWTEPENIGYPVNTSGDDLFYNPGWNDHTAYYAWRIENQSRSTLNALRFADRRNPENELLTDVQQSEDEPDDAMVTKSLHPDNQLTKRLQKQGNDDGPVSTETGYRQPPTTRAEVLHNHSAGNAKQIADHSDYLTLNSILFDYNDYRLTQTARKEVERLYTVMNNLPECSIELTGHTDSKGSEEYNLVLSYKRAESVADHLEALGIDRARISVTARGESDPVAINRYEDGSDAPNGRLLNRHTSFRFHNMPDDRVRVAEIMVPEKLRPVQDLAYRVILTENEQLISKMPSTFFGSEISIVKSGNMNLYLSEQFERKNQAVDLLNKAIDYGFPEARLMESRQLAAYINGSSGTTEGASWNYTIQIMALKRNRDASYFNALGPVMKYTGNDGFHRYTYGQYKNRKEAEYELTAIHRKGYRKAFIIAMEQLDKHREKAEAPTYYTKNELKGIAKGVQ